MKPPSPIALLKEAGLLAKKAWGQNFLLDQGVLSRIAEASGAGPGLPVVELGAGLGALTYHLLARGGNVYAVERDRELVPILSKTFEEYAPHLQILEADAAAFDYAAFSARHEFASIAVTGNLPYQLSGRILGNIADARDVIERASVLVQREVAQRLISTPGSKSYGLLSVMVQRAFDVRKVCEASPGAFHPPPKVHSAAVGLVRHQRYVGRLGATMVEVARAAFSTRRKTLRNALGGAMAMPSAKVAEWLEAAGIDGSRRAETLSLDEYAALAEAKGES